VQRKKIKRSMRICISSFAEKTRFMSNPPEITSSLNMQKRKGYARRYQLHLWINEREYKLLKHLAEAQEEPMSRIVRRAFGYLKQLVERQAA
jgi:hypothetical protein